MPASLSLCLGFNCRFELHKVPRLEPKSPRSRKKLVIVASWARRDRRRWRKAELSINAIVLFLVIQIPLALDRGLLAPTENPLTEEKVALRRRLFLDKRLSVDNSLACSDCHQPRHGALRDIELTAPYMHDGSFKSLEEVLNFYDGGGNPHPGLDPDIRPLSLIAEEKNALRAFLKTLTGSSLNK